MHFPTKKSRCSHPQLLRDRLLHRITALVIAVISLSQPICHVFADDSDEKQRRPNIIFILADDKYDVQRLAMVDCREKPPILAVFVAVPIYCRLRAIQGKSEGLTTFCYMQQSRQTLRSGHRGASSNLVAPTLINCLRTVAGCQWPRSTVPRMVTIPLNTALRCLAGSCKSMLSPTAMNGSTEPE
jgi:hypothetical protein